eukprot:scaffold149528_cov17-Prasinocladus_malaysianus.AAC.1
MSAIYQPGLWSISHATGHGEIISGCLFSPMHRCSIYQPRGAARRLRPQASHISTAETVLRQSSIQGKAHQGSIFIAQIL